MHYFSNKFSKIAKRWEPPAPLKKSGLINYGVIKLQE